MRGVLSVDPQSDVPARASGWEQLARKRAGLEAEREYVLAKLAELGVKQPNSKFTRKP